MAIFLDYKVAALANLSVQDPNDTSDTTVILEAEANTFFVTELTVCNTSASSDIRINLVIEIINVNGSEVVSTSAYRLKNVLIKASASINLMQLLVDQTRPPTAGGSLILVGTKTPAAAPYTVSRLKLFTNSITQQCDCTVTYAVLNETPWGGY